MKTNKQKRSHLAGHTEVVYTIQSDCQTLTLTSDRAGLTFSGEFTVDDFKTLEKLAHVISDAWSDHKALKTKLFTIRGETLN